MNKDNLTAFLYILMRDHTTPGEVSRLIREHVLVGEGENFYSNKQLAEMADVYATAILEGNEINYGQTRTT